MNNQTICGHCKKTEHCRMFQKDPHAVVTECGQYEETDLHKSIRESFLQRQVTLPKKSEKSKANEIRQLRERVDELEQTTERLRKTIEHMLNVDSMLLDFISETSKHVVNLERREEAEKMGVRLSVTWDDCCFECPHKYYGYEDLRKSASYNYLHDTLKVHEREKEDPDMLLALYNYWAPDAGPYTLSEDEFRQFVKLYLEDLTVVYPGKQVGGTEMLKDISEKPGNKQIYWG